MSSDKEINEQDFDLEDMMDGTDFAIVMDKNGSLKGMLIPSEDPDMEVPDNFTRILEEIFELHVTKADIQIHSDVTLH